MTNLERLEHDLLEIRKIVDNEVPGIRDASYDLLERWKSIFKRTEGNCSHDYAISMLYVELTIKLEHNLKNPELGI